MRLKGWIDDAVKQGASLLALRRMSDEVFHEQNPEGIMKIVPCEDILEADYNEVQHELTLSFRERGRCSASICR